MNAPSKPAAFPLSRFRAHNGTVWLSGQVPVRGSDPIPESFEAQARLVLENVRAALKEAGSSMDRVLKVNCFLRRESDMAAFNAVYQEFFSAPFPARTTLVAAPPNPKFLIEIEAVAAL
jgi:enamine deaminase RidA (YjgF/YER057c/UK114 family)